MYPEMRDRGYQKDFTVTLQAVGGTLGVLIPPSIPLVVYGSSTGTSTGDLFIAIFGAGILMCFLYCMASWYMIRKGRALIPGVVDTQHEKLSLKRIVTTFLDAI